MNAITPTDAILPSKLLQTSGLDWNVKKVNTFFRDDDGAEHKTGKQALVRADNFAVLSPNVSAGWQPVQNSAALGFFDEFCRAGQMKMEKAGALANGRFVYAFARIEESFELPGNDLVEAFMLFCNPHIVGRSINIFLTPRRFFCMNQLPMLLNAKNGKYRQIHTAKFEPEQAKRALGISKGMFGDFREKAELLARKRFTQPMFEEFFNRVFPGNVQEPGDAANDDAATVGTSRRAMLCLANQESQPGAEASTGTGWHAFNTVTYVVDHVLGRSEDTRQANALFGWSRQRKQEALAIALKMAA